MKKLVCCLLVLVFVVSCSAAALGEWAYGAFYPSITKAFSGGRGDEYSYWTNDNTQLALLAILLCEDMKREDYSAYNACFPIDYLSGVLYHTGKRPDNTIKVVYACTDAYLAIEYNMDYDTAFYTVDRQIPDYDAFESYVKRANGGDYSGVWYNYYPFDFYDPVPAFSTAAQTWSNYLDHHPELNNNLNIGW